VSRDAHHNLKRAEGPQREQHRWSSIMGAKQGMRGTLSEPLSLSSLMVLSGVSGTATHTRGSPPISSCRSLTLVLTCVSMCHVRVTASHALVYADAA